MHVDYPWDVALSRVVSVPTILQRWRGLPRPYTSCNGTSRVRSLPAGTGNMAFKPPFFFLYYCSEVPRPEASTPVPWPLTVPPPPRSSLPVGIGGWHHLGQSTLWGQRVTPLRWSTSKLVDAYLATSTPGDAQGGQHTNFLPWSPLVSPNVCLTLVNARGRVSTIINSIFIIILFISMNINIITLIILLFFFFFIFL